MPVIVVGPSAKGAMAAKVMAWSEHADMSAVMPRNVLSAGGSSTIPLVLSAARRGAE